MHYSVRVRGEDGVFGPALLDTRCSEPLNFSTGLLLFAFLTPSRVFFFEFFGLLFGIQVLLLEYRFFYCCDTGYSFVWDSVAAFVWDIDIALEILVLLLLGYKCVICFEIQVLLLFEIQECLSKLNRLGILNFYKLLSILSVNALSKSMSRGQQSILLVIIKFKSVQIIEEHLY